MLVRFSEASALIRAFRRWTGLTPHGYANQSGRAPMGRDDTSAAA